MVEEKYATSEEFRYHSSLEAALSHPGTNPLTTISTLSISRLTLRNTLTLSNSNYADRTAPFFITSDGSVGVLFDSQAIESTSTFSINKTSQSTVVVGNSALLVTSGGTPCIPTASGSGKVLTSDANGLAYWNTTAASTPTYANSATYASNAASASWANSATYASQAGSLAFASTRYSCIEMSGFNANHGYAGGYISFSNSITECLQSRTPMDLVLPTTNNSCFFEAALFNDTAGITGYCLLWNSTDSASVVAVSTTSTSVTRQRSAAISINPAKTYSFKAWTSVTSSVVAVRVWKVRVWIPIL